MVAIIASGMPPLMSYRLVKDTQEQQLQTYREQPLVERSIQSFRDKAASATTVEEVLNDWEMRTFILQAYGLSELSNSRALVDQILTDDLTQENATALVLRDNRFRDMALTLRLDEGLDSLKNAAIQEVIIKRYENNGFEEEIGEVDISVRQALYFERSIGASDTIFQLMSDATLKEVFVTAFGLPQEFNLLDFDKQVDILTEKIDVDRLKDPEYIGKIVNDFLFQKSLQQASATQDPIVNLFQKPNEGGVQRLDISILA